MSHAQELPRIQVFFFPSAGRGILDKATRTSAHNRLASKDTDDLNSTPTEGAQMHVQHEPLSHHAHLAESDADARSLSTEAALLGEVERMPEELDPPAVRNPFVKRTTTLSPGGKMKPSSHFQANEIKQSKRNR